MRRVVAMLAVAGGVLAGVAPGPAGAESVPGANGDGLVIPGSGDIGPADPYPSTIEIAGATGVVTDVRVRLAGVTAAGMSDLDILLVGPNGDRGVVLLSDVSGPDVAGVDLTFVEGQGPVPSPPVSGRYRPTNVANDVDAWDDPAPAGPHANTLGVFDGMDPNGTWSLYVQDDNAGDDATIESWSLRIITGVESEVPIVAGPDAGPADVYPSVINVGGLTGEVTSVSVTLTNLTSSQPDDLDVLLVAPDGQRIMLLSDAGGDGSTSGTSLTFEAGATPLTDEGGLGPGVYAPTDHDGGDQDVFEAPAPPGATSTDLASLTGSDPNGAWQLYVTDDSSDPLTTSRLVQGWSIDVRSGDDPPLLENPCAFVPDDGFTDVTADNVHESNIDCIAHYGIARGTSATTYGPFSDVSRAQMASFVARLVLVAGGELPSDPGDAFPGDDGVEHERSIDQLSAVGIVGGNGETGDLYNVSSAMRRDHMASFLARAYEHILGIPLPAGPDAFPDDDGNPHEDEINALAAAGVVQGNSGQYDPAGSVSRSSMGSFLARTLRQLVEDGAEAEPLDTV